VNEPDQLIVLPTALQQVSRATRVLRDDQRAIFGEKLQIRNGRARSIARSREHKLHSREILT
jgi:hypothetical protein